MNSIWKSVIITFVVVILIGFAVLIFESESPSGITITPSTGSRENRIGVFGAVKEPGYYTYKGDLRIEDAVEFAGGLAENADAERANMAKWIDDGETIIIPTAGPERPTMTPIAGEDEKIDLNTADAAELMKLPGIGEKRAEEIIRLREQKGGFGSKEDLLEISGISENLLEKIYDRLIIQ